MTSKVTQLKSTGKFAVSFAVEAKSLREEDTDDGRFGLFKGYASTFGNVDKHSDIVARGAFSETISKGNKVKMLWQHDMWNLIGSFIEIKEDDFGLLVTGRVNLGTQQGKDAFALVKAGDLDTMSIGYMVNDFTIDRESGVRILEDLELMEISLVTIPANDMAQITAVKSYVPTEILPIATEEEAKSVDITNILDVDNDETYLKSACLYSNNGKHSLLIGMKFDEKVKAIPEFVRKAAKDVIDLDITDQEKALIRQTLSKYYKEMGEDSPWEPKSLDKVETITDVEDYLKDNNFSNKEAKKLISKIKEFSRQRDVDDKKAKQKERDAVDGKAIVSELTDLTNLIKGGQDG